MHLGRARCRCHKISTTVRRIRDDLEHTPQSVQDRSVFGRIDQINVLSRNFCRRIPLGDFLLGFRRNVHCARRREQNDPLKRPISQQCEDRSILSRASDRGIREGIVQSGEREQNPQGLNFHRIPGTLIVALMRRKRHKLFALRVPPRSEADGNGTAAF